MADSIPSERALEQRGHDPLGAVPRAGRPSSGRLARVAAQPGHVRIDA
ncbi:MAG TPA: hypothetical protein VNJ53_07070 [Gaiellaceae bacterium]|nr:hypothetical protein [Gaiellaceae bacterium]